MTETISAPNSLLTGQSGIIRVKATLSGHLSDEQKILFDRIDELQSDKSILLSALAELSGMYGSTWDCVDGCLLMMASGIERFEKAHEAAKTALMQAVTLETR